MLIQSWDFWNKKKGNRYYYKFILGVLILLFPIIDSKILYKKINLLKPQNVFFKPINPSIYCGIALYPLFYDLITYLIATFHLFSNTSRLQDICNEYWLDSIYMISWYELWLASHLGAGGSLELGCTSSIYLLLW